jgi:hypothetical protein
MGRKRHKPEKIVAKPRRVDVLTTQGQSVAEAVRSARRGASESKGQVHGRRRTRMIEGHDPMCRAGCSIC